MKSIATLSVFAVAALGVAGQNRRVEITVAKDHIDFRAGGELVARYQMGPKFPRPIFWPLLAPGGIPVTRSWPMDNSIAGESKDHVHQKSAWFCHGDVIPEGLTLKHKIRGVAGVDFWSEAKGHGRIATTRVGKPNVKDGAGSVTLHNEWRTADGEKIMDETRKITLHDFGKSRLIVLDIDLVASVCPITFGDTKEGALGIRINDQIRGDRKGKITNAEGKINEKGCWGQISAWCDYSGPIDGKVAGLAVFADPQNPYPSCWHARNYGLLAANPFGRSRAAFPATKGRTDLVRLDQGQHLRLRYGILVHTGDCAGEDGGRKSTGNADTRAVDNKLYDVLRDIANRGATLFNKQDDWAGCARIYEGGLITARAFLAHRPDLQRTIDAGIRRAATEPQVSDRAFAFRKVLDQVRDELKSVSGGQVARMYQRFVQLR